MADAMQTVVDTFVALAGDTRIYTQAEKMSDHSYGLYRYTEIDCKCCRRPGGVYAREVIGGVAGLLAYYCGQCRANNPGKFDDLM